MKTMRQSLLPLTVLVKPRPATVSHPVPVAAPSRPARPAKAAQQSADPAHRFHARTHPADSRPGVAASGAMVRVRGNAQEFHKVAAVGARHIPGGLVAKRRAGK